MIFDDRFGPPGGAAPRRTPLTASRHAFEEARLDSLSAHRPFAPSEDSLLRCVALQATQACGVPMGIVSLMAGDEERFVARVGTELRTIERNDSFCAYAVLEPDVLAVEDAQLDPRFRENRFVVGEPFVRFYLGAPIFDEHGLPLGAVCAVGFHPQEATSRRRLALSRLAEVAGAVLQARLLFARTLALAPTDEAEAHHTRFESLLLTLVGSCLPPG